MTEFITDPSKFHALLLHNDIEVDVDFFDNWKMNENGTAEIVRDETISVTWKKNKESIECGKGTNPVVAAFVTSWARIELLKRLQESSEDSMYCDTDSCISLKDLPIGNCLGDWDRENIVVDKFVCGGPKSYCFLTKDGKEVCKYKGFCINGETEHLLTRMNLENVIRSSFDKKENGSERSELSERSERSERRNKDKRITIVNERKITRNKNGTLMNKYEEKEFTFDFDKRVACVLKNGDIITYPYGY